jgi:hypothetical protein
MPLYSWIDERSQIPVTLYRSVADIEVPPTEEESTIPPAEATWRRIVCATRWQRGDNWGAGKGRW